MPLSFQRLNSMHRSILQIALPSIVSNITVPLLALVDTAIVGHLGSPAYIAAIALGGMIFNMVYWLFGFLRMGTGGLTAQTYGAGDVLASHRLLGRSLLVGGAFSLLLWVLQVPILHTVFCFVPAEPEVRQLAATYFRILIWGAPAVLGLYSLVGWFLGMQRAKLPMLIAIVQNVVNILASLFLVCVLGWKVEGVALGTLLAQYAGLLLALWLWRTRFERPEPTLRTWRTLLRDRASFVAFFQVNRDIFLRTLCLIAVTVSFTSFGSAQGELTLAANTLLMQFFLLFSYIMDGFAYAGEALGGRYYGARDTLRFARLHRSLLLWGSALALLFTLGYGFGGSVLLRLLTDEVSVIAQASHHLSLICAVPFIGFAAFLYDGLYIGTTSTRYMLLTMVLATLLFFGLYALLPPANTSLWLAFLTYLGCRSLVQALYYPKVKQTVAHHNQ